MPAHGIRYGQFGSRSVPSPTVGMPRIGIRNGQYGLPKPSNPETLHAGVHLWRIACFSFGPCVLLLLASANHLFCVLITTIEPHCSPRSWKRNLVFVVLGMPAFRQNGQSCRTKFHRWTTSPWTRAQHHCGHHVYEEFRVWICLPFQPSLPTSRVPIDQGARFSASSFPRLLSREDDHPRER